MWTTVRFLGCWDCVSALGVPFPWLDVVLDRVPLFRHRFHRFDLSEVVEHGRHALAIDDDRLSFHPELWPEPAGREPGAEPGAKTMKQVWFAGSHSDVGGGYREQGLSDVALDWMLIEAVSAGLRLQPGHRITLEPSATGRLHDPRGRGLGHLYRRRVRSWPSSWGPPTVHASVLERAVRSRELGGDPVYAPWILERFDNDEIGVEPWSRPAQAARVA